MMELAAQVVSLALAKRLKELGAQQDSLFSWVTTTWNEEPYLTASECFDTLDAKRMEVSQDSGVESDSWDVLECYAAFTVAELGELLPRCYSSWATPQNGEMQWWCHRMEWHFVTHEETPTFTADTEADARAKMLIHLLERAKEQK